MAKVFIFRGTFSRFFVGCMFIIGIVVSCSSNTDPLPKPISNFINTEKARVSWSYSSLSKSPSSSFIPIVDDNILFTSDRNGNIYRIDPTDGTIIKVFKLKYKLSSGIAVSSDSVFVTTEDGYLLAISKATGEIKWRVQLPTVSIEAPQASNNIVLVRTNDAQVLAYSTVKGDLLWVYQRSSPPLTVRVYNTFQIIGEEVALLGQPGGHLVLVNLNTGVSIWDTYVALPEGATDLDKLTDVSTRPIINGKEICVATYNGRLSCLDAITSSITWSKKISTIYGLLMDEQNVYALSQDGVIYAYDRYTGAIVWSNNILQYRSVNSPVFLGNNILIIDTDGYINLFNRGDGTLVGRYSSNLKGVISYPWSNGKKVIVQSGDGTIVAITQ